MTRVIRSANHSSYPVGADDLRDEATEAIVVAEQSRAFLDIVTDGQVRWPDARAHFAACVDADLRRVAPMAVPGYVAACAVTPKPVKVSLPGPATLLAMAAHRNDEGSRPLAGRALADEVRALGEAGCRWFQLEDPHLTHVGDLEACATVLAAAPEGSVTIWWPGPEKAVALGDACPGTHLGLDVTDPVRLEILAHLPPGRGVMLGLFDAASEQVEDADERAARLTPWREALAGRDVLVGPNGGLAGLPRDVAFEKLLQARYLVEELRRRWSVSASPR
jgi:methionine synthase II (cobalamin-independent)